MHRDELEVLLNALVAQAERMLRAHGDFFPFGGLLWRDGQMEAIALGPEEAPDSLQEWRGRVLRRLRSETAASEACQAAALLLHVEVDVPGRLEPVPGIQVSLEHRSGRRYRLFIPYRGRGDGMMLGSALVDSEAVSLFPRPTGLELQGAA